MRRLVFTIGTVAALALSWASPATAVADSYTCPPGFLAFPLSGPYDRNDNDVVCMRLVNTPNIIVIIFIDDHPAPATG